MSTCASVIGIIVVLWLVRLAVKSIDGWFESHRLRKEDRTSQRVPCRQMHIGRHLRSCVNMSGLQANSGRVETQPAPVSEDVIRTKVFRDYLGSLSIDVLKSYTGIGDGTIRCLKHLGLRTLRDVEQLAPNSFDDVAGVGPARADLVRSAVNYEVYARRREFNSEAGPFALRVAAEIRTLSAERDATIARNLRVKAQLRGALGRLQNHFLAAQKITFEYFRSHRQYTAGSSAALRCHS